MEEYIRVKNWSKFQHYKGRRPLWIKLYNELLDDVAFSCLQDASKLHLILLWLLASRLTNRIPNNHKWITEAIHATSPIDFDALLNSGFIEIYSDASNTLATGYQVATLETERETEKEREYIPPNPLSGGTSELPFKSPEFADAWGKWVTYREDIGKELSAVMVDAQLKSMRDMGEANAIAMIQQTIARGRRNLVELLKPSLPKPNPQSNLRNAKLEMSERQRRRDEESEKVEVEAVNQKRELRALGEDEIERLRSIAIETHPHFATAWKKANPLESPSLRNELCRLAKEQSASADFADGSEAVTCSQTLTKGKD